ncbi:MAG: DJ-1/PfpI family protein [Dokdonella sp.]
MAVCNFIARLITAAMLLLGVSGAQASEVVASILALAGTPVHEETIAPYHARFGRQRPLIAVVGENGSDSSTVELTDFVVPYGILAQSGAADMIALATHAGPLKMRPALQIEPRSTTAQFDVDVPDGADYVIVPAVRRISDPVLLAWISGQAAKGATLVSICDGALVVANTGLMKGRRATAHWDTEDLRATRYPDTHWQRNVRYVADGNIVSSAGISAAIPVSLALIEAIAGHEAAAVVGAQIGVPQWSSMHDSDVFRPRFGTNLSAFIRTAYTNAWLHVREQVGVTLTAGVDDIALALTVDAWSRTGRSQGYAVAASMQPVTSKHGLVFVPEPVVARSRRPGILLPDFGDMLSTHALDRALAGIAERYGRSTAYGVALDFEYPGFERRRR